MYGITLTKCKIYFNNIYSTVSLEEKLGGGTYGDVYKGKVIKYNNNNNNDLYQNTNYLPYDYYTDEFVFFRKNIYAIKFFRDDLKTINEEGISCTTLRELSCLKNIGRHPNILRLIDVTIDRQKCISEYINRQILQHHASNFQHSKKLDMTPLSADQKFIFAAYEYCDAGDLKRLIQKTKITDDQAGLSLKEAKWLSFQLLNGLAYLHNNKMCHRDLKPENVMLQHTPNRKYLLKIGDLGLCRELKNDGDMTPTVCTIYYRPLEVLLSKFEMAKGKKGKVKARGKAKAPVNGLSTCANPPHGNNSQINHPHASAPHSNAPYPSRAISTRGIDSTGKKRIHAASAGCTIDRGRAEGNGGNRSDQGNGNSNNRKKKNNKERGKETHGERTEEGEKYTQRKRERARMRGIEEDDYYNNKDFQYGLNVDIWSAACIICELIIGRPLFRGVTEFDLIIRIVNSLGKPNNDELEFFSDSRFYPLKEDFFNVNIKNKKDALNVITNGRIDELGIDLLVKMLKYNPNDRITAADALSHPWFSDIRFDNLDGIGVYNWYVHCLKYYIGIKTFREIEQKKKNLLTTTMISHFLCKSNDRHGKIIFKLINDTFKNLGGYKKSGRRSFAIFSDQYAKDDKNANGFIKRASIKVLNDMKEKNVIETKEEMSFYDDSTNYVTPTSTSSKRRKFNRSSYHAVNPETSYEGATQMRVKRNLSIPDFSSPDRKKQRHKDHFKSATTTNRAAAHPLPTFHGFT
ncbi:cdc2-like protein kinase, putative [Plasmodium knowlesi strain H]|uniref:Cyclin-dependent kinase 2 homolog n=3 Tax=Plasmodium knowlesi TaxID=5850 RepID=A0A5K1TUZ9_PLAKH|nr:cdc2-like protein kinase, putative [Plasmodium knowlesi strain H]OTN64488.1 putative Cdc2-like protein kinase [Plasmodium knowlesi]CAA9989170.1 cdc2-like protein kinase, putative [Plasmodium knowlesi strain H]SBO27390.1 cdc2-like protein kinase, putative [Plasmodium knowlesi strain H]SBO27499.1 cdc2-like protein kinase, putative [Plasmodium knowlesi strain H]VVS78644.1 cdc2-like protein kinase, putative [Plasmodium knowlesi strain H]|eukprot:XP_002261517.1 cdc2-like protein kinase, putative [Plasmodium knowlesi strain H]